MYLLIYVDDILLTGNNLRAMTDLISALGATFALKDLGDAHYFLGMETIRTSKGLFLSQCKYIIDLLRRTSFDGAKPISSPMSPTTHLHQADGTPLPDPTSYRSTVGALQYLTLTRPDLSFSVNKVCQYLHAPTDLHWAAVKLILRYLKDTVNHGLLLKPASTFTLHSYSDADWAGSADDRKSRGGYAVFFESSLISWSSRKQRTVAQSSTEAEYKTIADATAEITWLQSLLRKLGVHQHHTAILWCDNLGVTYLTANHVFHARTKHVEIDFHFVRDKVARQKMEVRFLPSQDQLADGLTKAPRGPQFTFIRHKLNIQPLEFRLRGAVKPQRQLVSSTPSADNPPSSK